MSKAPKRRLYAKLSSFKWREGWQNAVVFYGPFLLMILLGILATLAAPLLHHQRDPWTEGDRLTGTIVGFAERQTETCAPAEPLVELDGGAVVHVCNSARVRFETGLRVVVQEYLLEGFDQRRYQIISLDERDEEPN
ncbi:MAG: hypothetical protein OEM93_10800 [Rhodospirillales bacterium]|nr:hypothetical protein [Rhodospirillales bacterium]MDH3967899.1 hypothetical protein [Rhodospirillales bacterium]